MSIQTGERKFVNNVTVSGDLKAETKFGLAVAPVVQQTHVANPSGGATQDAESRAAINSILQVLETFGFTATS